MELELNSLLCTRYPLIFKDQTKDSLTGAPYFRFEVGSGWWTILDALCESIYAPYRQAEARYQFLRKSEGAERRTGQGAVSAVDVERARLAMAAAALALPRAVQVKEKFGTLRFYARNATDTVQRLIDMAEVLSGKMCDVCGAPGKLSNTGWIRTRCDLHQQT